MLPLISCCKNGLKNPAFKPLVSSARIMPKQAEVKPTPTPVGTIKKVCMISILNSLNKKWGADSQSVYCASTCRASTAIRPSSSVGITQICGPVP